ncbi:transposase [Xanthomonas citri pv. fuscans]|nr:transposase [Xanthomonas citri pv. fuscans]SOO32061.1 transposase [Xanthomonas citri pv. fuscans]
MIGQGDMHKIFSPGARQTLTNDSRQKSGAVQVGEQWTRVGPLLSTYRIDMRQHHRDPRPTFPFLRFRCRLARHRCTKIRITDRRRAQKNGRSMSGHRMPASTTPDQ